MSTVSWRDWIQASRAKFFIATIIPLALGGTVAAKAGAWDTGMWLVILLASFLVHLNTNLANDYFEHLGGVDASGGIGGSRVIQEGKITPNQIRNFLIAGYFIALVCGLYLLWATRLWWLIGVMLFSFFSSVFYTAKPIRYGYHGLGELMVGLNMGPILTAGTASTLMGRLSLEAVGISLPIGILVAFILYYQSISDIDDDRRAGKITVAVRLGRKGVVVGFRLFVWGTAAAMLGLVLTRFIHPLGTLSIVTPYILKDLDRAIRSACDLRALHELGQPVRQFYVINGMMLIFAVALKL